MSDRYEVCARCDGEGSIVNPAIDPVTPDQFAEDLDFEEAYFAGVYDVVCPTCNGLRVVTKERLKEAAEEEQVRRTMLMESGAWPF